MSVIVNLHNPAGVSRLQTAAVGHGANPLSREGGVEAGAFLVVAVSG
jgi:hypothetical protein